MGKPEWVRELLADDFELEFDTERSNPTQKAGGTPDSVIAMIAPYLQGSPFTLRVIRT